MPDETCAGICSSGRAYARAHAQDRGHATPVRLGAQSRYDVTLAASRDVQARGNSVAQAHGIAYHAACAHAHRFARVRTLRARLLGHVTR